MSARLRVLTWNCKRASPRSGLWDYLQELDPDIALLQDFGAIPARVLERYHHAPSSSPGDVATGTHHQSGLLVKANAVADVELPVQVDWIARELEILRGNITAKKLTLSSGLTLTAMSAYLPAFPIARQRLEGIDLSTIKLTHSRDVWSTEILWIVLRSMNIAADELLIVGGDFNSSETFDHGPKGPKGNLEAIERMNGLGLVECLRKFQEQLVPTFRSPRGGQIEHQLDHLYVTAPLLKHLVHCDVGSTDRIFGPRPMLSDHLPIVADFGTVDGVPSENDASRSRTET